MKISNIYVSITGYLLKVIDTNWCRKNSQHYMLAYTDFNHNSIDTHKQVIFPTFMLEDGVYITRSLN